MEEDISDIKNENAGRQILPPFFGKKTPRQKIEILLQNIIEQLNFIELEVDDILPKYEKSIKIAVELIQIKKGNYKIGFRSEFEEINFFKILKEDWKM